MASVTKLGRNEKEIIKLIGCFEDLNFTELVELSSLKLNQVRKAVRPLVADGVLLYEYNEEGRAVYRLPRRKEVRRG